MMADLEALSRKELQALAKQHGIKANLKVCCSCPNLSEMRCESLFCRQSTELVRQIKEVLCFVGETDENVDEKDILTPEKEMAKTGPEPPSDNSGIANTVAVALTTPTPTPASTLPLPLLLLRAEAANLAAKKTEEPSTPLHHPSESAGPSFNLCVKPSPRLSTPRQSPTPASPRFGDRSPRQSFSPTVPKEPSNHPCTCHPVDVHDPTNGNLFMLSSLPNLV
jgi:hypothetical protein